MEKIGQGSGEGVKRTSEARFEKTEHLIRHQLFFKVIIESLKHG